MSDTTIEPGDKENQQWLDAIAGKPDASADPTLNQQATVLRQALIKRNQEIITAIPEADPAGYERLLAELQRQGLLDDKPKVILIKLIQKVHTFLFGLLKKGMNQPSPLVNDMTFPAPVSYGPAASVWRGGASDYATHADVVSRRQATAQQLDCAIQLLSEGQVIAAVTLAAAATRVLTDLLGKDSNGTPSKLLRGFYEQIDLPDAQKNEFHIWLNEVYDWLRHADKAPDSPMEISEMEAQMWIKLGIASFSRHFNDMTPAMKLFARRSASSIPINL